MALLQRIGTFIYDIFDSISSGRRAYSRYMTLNNMDDRSLKDIGITRGDIPRLAFTSRAWR